MNKRSVLFPFLVAALALVLMLGLAPVAAQSAPATPSRPSDVAAPIIENVGQFPAEVRFQLRADGSTLWLADDAIWITFLADGEAASRRDLDFALARDGDFAPQLGVNLKLTFPGAAPHPRLEPFDRLDMHVSYFLGADPAGWRPDVPVWGGARYVDLYPGVNLEVSAIGGRLTWRLVGDAAETVRLRIEGADEVTLEGDALRVATAIGELRLPLLERIGANGKPFTTPAQPEVIGDEVVAPFGAPRSSAAPTAVDAVGLVYSTFLGGNGDDYSGAIAVDSTGAAYVVGYTASTNFPTTTGAFDVSQNGSNDVFVAKLNSSGGSLAYATFVGGSGTDEGFGIALDANGNAYVSGHTYSSNFPTTAGAFDPTPNGQDDAFVLKLNPSGTALVYSTVIGGSGRDWSHIIAINASGEAHIIGTTIGSGFPTTPGAYQTSARGGWDVLAVKLAANGGSLVYSTLLGGGYDDYGAVLALDSAGSVYLSGWTCSSDFPTTAGAFDRTFGGCSYDTGGDAFVTKLNSTGTGLVYSTYLGGSNYDASGAAITVNASGEAYVAGFTRSSDFPLTAGAYDTTPNGAEDATLVKLNAAGSSLLYGTLLGGSGFDAVWGMAVSGNTVYLSGATASANFPTTADAYDRTYAGGTCGSYACRDIFAAKLDMAANQLLYSTYLGGGNDDYQNVHALAVDGSGAMYLAGWTKSSDFPTTAAAFDTSHNGGADVFVAKLGEPETSYSIAGWVRDSGGTGIGGVTISAGGGRTTTTASNGYYALTDLPAGTYSLSAAKSGCTFSPSSRSVTVPPSQIDQNFTATCGAPPNTRVKISPATKRAPLSGTFTVDLVVENVTNFGAFQTELTYDPAIVHVTTVAIGSFPGSTGRTVSPVGPTIDNGTGKVTFGAFTFGTQAGPSGTGVLATITFQPRAVGTTTLHLQNLGLADPTGANIPVTSEDGQVQITRCFGDFDGDNDVDIFDLQRAASHWNCRTGDACYDAQFDTEPDGDIDVFDLQRFAAAWGTSCSVTVAQRRAGPAFEQAVLPEAPAAADLSLLPASRQAAPAEVFTQTVRLADAANVGAFQATLTYDPTVVQVEDATLGSFLGSTGRTVVPVGPTIDNAAGRVTFGAFTFGGQTGASGTGDLAYVRLRAGTGGRTNLTFQNAGLSDPQGNALPLGSQTGGQVTVGTQASVTLVPSAQITTVGREFSVTVRISNAANLAAFQTTLTYDPAVAQALGATLGPF